MLEPPYDNTTDQSDRGEGSSSSRQAHFLKFRAVPNQDLESNKQTRQSVEFGKDSGLANPQLSMLDAD